MSQAPVEVEKDGQKLTHTTAPEVRRRRGKRKAPPPPAVDLPEAEGEPDPDDPMSRIAARHVERVDAAPPEPELEIPTPELDFVGPDGEDVPPPMEPRPSQRQGLTVEDAPQPPVATLDEPAPPRNFDDLMNFDLGERWYVHVVRRAPKSHNGARCDGEQKPIRRKMKATEFAREYGGLEYEFTVYGPPKRGEQIDPMTSLPIFVPRTKPIRVTLPGSPPNLHMAIGYDDVQEDDMESSPSGFTRARPGMSNNADARIHETNLEHEREMDARAERRRNEEREAARAARIEREKERERVERERESRESSAADAFARMHASSMESQRELLKAAFAGRPGAGEDEKRYLHEALRELQTSNQEYINRLQENHAAALERIQAQYRAELERSETQHRAEINRLQDQLVAERARCDTIVRDTERQHNDRSREAEARAAKEIEQVRREATERVDAQRREQEARREDERLRQADRHTDLKDAHDRELRARDSKWESQLASERAGFDSRMAVKDHELKLLREDNARLRRENEKPIHERVREITETAEALGMKRPEEIETAGGPEELSIQQMLFRMGSDAIQNLPGIISSASDAVSRLRSGGTAAQQAEFVRMQQGRMAADAAAHPLAQPPVPQVLPFAIDGENDFQPAAHAPPVAFPPAFAAPVAPPPQPAAVPSQPPAAPAVPPPPPVAGAEPPVAGASEAPPSAAPPSVAPAPNGAAPPDPALEAMVLENAEAFEKALAGQVAPPEVGAYIASKVPKAYLGEILKMISPEMIRNVLQRTGRASSPLCRRDGQKYLRAVQAELEKIAQAPS